MSRFRAAVRAAAAVGAVALVLQMGTAHADNVTADGDGATPIASNGLSFGTDVCTGTTVDKTVLLTVERNGTPGNPQSNQNIFADNSQVTLSVAASPAPPAGVTLSISGSTKVKLPNNWTAQANNTQAGSVTLAARLVAGASPRMINQSVTINASGTNVNGQAVTRTTSLAITATVRDCTPPDTVAPVVTVPTAATAEATSAAGAVVSYVASATDAVDGPVGVTCSPASGSTFPIGTTTVSCTARDAAGNTGRASFPVTVSDTTAPTFSSFPADITGVEATGAAGAPVEFALPTAADAADTTPTVACAVGDQPVVPGDTFPLGTSTVACTATDDAGNTGSDSFVVSVVDTTAPAIDAVADITGVEATSGGGAVVSYDAPAATDVVDGPVDVTCAAASGSTFALGSTSVTCSATDAAGNTGTRTFAVVVQDSVAPVLTLPDDLTAEATSADGADVEYEVTAEDVVDGAVTPDCAPASGRTFELGSTDVECSATDAHQNLASGSFSVTVEDTTAPVLVGVSDLTLEAASAAGTAATFAVTATDAVDADPTVTCASADGLGSGDVFPFGPTSVTCTATDAAGNTSEPVDFTVTVEDTLAPVLSTVADIRNVEATSPAGAIVGFALPTATDAVGAGEVTCTPARGTFALGTTPVICSATDEAGNVGQTGFTVTVVDTTAPSLTIPADQLLDATGPSGAVATYAPTGVADLVDTEVAVTCAPPSGSTFAIGGPWTVSCSAVDDFGNATNGQFTVTVRRTMSNFFSPVGTARTVNGVKAGSTVPLKFEVTAGPTELTSTGFIRPVAADEIDCKTQKVIRAIDPLASGSAGLRYDATAGQYVFNWKTPSKANTCYAVSVSTYDGVGRTAYFQLK